MKRGIAYLASVIDATLIISIISSQLVLADVASFGLDVPINVRLATTASDLAGLGPALLVLVAATYAVAFTVAAFGRRRFGGSAYLWYPVAGLTSLPVAIVAIKWLMGGTLLASARTPLGMALVALGSMSGGWLYCWLLEIFERRAGNDQV